MGGASRPLVVFLCWSFCTIVDKTESLAWLYLLKTRPHHYEEPLHCVWIHPSVCPPLLSLCDVTSRALGPSVTVENVRHILKSLLLVDATRPAAKVQIFQL